MNDIEIPTNSFTAFRLTYLQIREIAETSKTLFLGNVPVLWNDDRGKGLINTMIHKAKTNAINTFDNTYRSYLLKEDWHSSNEWFKFSNNKSIEKIIQELYEVDSKSDAYSEMPITPIYSENTTLSIKTLKQLESELNKVPKDVLASPIIRVDGTVGDKPCITTAKPEPINEIKGLTENLIDEREHHQFRKRLKEFAKISTGKAWDTTNDLRDRITNSIIGNFKIGEVVLQEKVLVLTKETFNTSKVFKFEENEPCDTRVYARWKEHKILLKKTANHMITIQFIQVDNDNEVAEYEYELQHNVTVNLYNYLDKSLCLLVPKNHWSIIHIIKFHDQMKSTRWLYFMNQVLGNQKENVFDILIPEIDMQLSITIPESFLLEIVQKPLFLKVKQLPKGYNVEHSVMIQYLLDTIKQKITESGDNKLTSWLQSTVSPWFCFRYYDRLEWIVDDSELFYLQNQLFKTTFVLEIRDMINYKRMLKVDNQSFAPLPIEGFLSRLSDINGAEKGLKSFYKLLYFYTCDNLLYFTRYYMAILPESEILLDKNTNREMAIYGAYNLDENDHIPWFRQDFKVWDKIAFKEFERKSQLILKADNVIDLNHVVSIRPIPVEDLTLWQRSLFGLTWYGNRNLENDELLDSAFELTVINLGKIKLVAPNRVARDLWVEKLMLMVKYWKTRKQLEIETINEVRRCNMKRLNIDEMTDSNIGKYCNMLEINNSTANAYLNTIDYISLGNSLMINGYLYQKYKKHANFSQYFVALSSGNLVLYSLYQRSKVTGEWKRSCHYQHHLTIPIRDCYVYSGDTTLLDLVERHKDNMSDNPMDRSLPRIYSDGWKSSEEESTRCFTIWFGKKRNISKKAEEPNNPGIIRLIRRLGITGKSMMFLTRSRQERDLWVSRIYAEIDRFTRFYGDG